MSGRCFGLAGLASGDDVQQNLRLAGRSYKHGADVIFAGNEHRSADDAVAQGRGRQLVLNLGEDTVIRNGTLDPGEDANANGVLDPVYDPAKWDREVVDGIWGEFDGNDTKRADGTPMEYSHAGNYGDTAAELLVREKGQCTAWADLLVITLGVHGVSARVQEIYANFTVEKMPAQGSGPADYNFGTGDPTPDANFFLFHEVVRVDVYADRIFDPSYGDMSTATATEPVESVYEDKNIVKVFNGIRWIDQTEDWQDLVFN